MTKPEMTLWEAAERASNTFEDFSSYINTVLSYPDMNQIRLAQIMGVSQSAISNWRVGRKIPKRSLDRYNRVMALMAFQNEKGESFYKNLSILEARSHVTRKVNDLHFEDAAEAFSFAGKIDALVREFEEKRKTKKPATLEDLL